VVTLRYLLDTNIVAEPLRPSPHPVILEQIRRHQDEIAIASVVWHEMWYGCYRLPLSARRNAIEAYLTRVIGPSISILPYDDEAATWHAAERARLASLGKTTSFADGMIAAVAQTNNLILVTLNRGDYHLFQGLQLVSWREEPDDSGHA